MPVNDRLLAVEMGNLASHIRDEVTINFREYQVRTDQRDVVCRESSISGRLIEVTPYSNVEVEYLRWIDPTTVDWTFESRGTIRDIYVSPGEIASNVFQQHAAIPFIGEDYAITVIFNAKTGRVYYNNAAIVREPRAFEDYSSKVLTDGSLKKLREASFGEQHTK